MQENYELVQRGFRILLGSLSGFIGQEMRRVHRNRWWNVVLVTLSEQRDLPLNGEYGYLVDSLDIANCIRLLDRQWNEVFKERLPQNCRNWAKELMGVRNIVSHIGQQDLSKPEAERALDTMALLCMEIDPDSAEEIRVIYQEVRSRAEESYRPEPIRFEERAGACGKVPREGSRTETFNLIGRILQPVNMLTLRSGLLYL